MRGIISAMFLAALAARDPVAAQGLTKLDISVSAYPSTSVSVPYVVGRKLGVFKQEGIEIGRLSGTGGGGQTVRNVISGELAFGDVAPAAAATAFMKGEKIVVVGGGVRAVADVYYVARKDSPIKAIEDLKGKAVGFTSPGSNSQAALLLSLKAAGINPADVNARPMGGVSEAIAGLVNGALDASINIEPVYSSDPGPFKIVFRVAQYVPALQQTVLITRPQFLKEDPEAVRRFLRAYDAAVSYTAEHPERAAEAWSKETDIDVEIMRKVIGAYNKGHQWSVGFDVPALRAIDEVMHLMNNVKAEDRVPWNDMIDQSFLPAHVEKIDPSKISGK